MNNENVIVKIKKISHVLSVLLKICQIFCIVGASILGAALIYIGIFNGLDSIIINERITVQAPLSKDILQDMGTNKVMILCTVAMIKMGFYIAIFVLTRNIFEKIAADNSPFKLAHVNKMRIIAILMFIANTINTSIEKTDFPFDFNMAGIAGGFIIFAFSYIFEYGCRLQTESDETL